MKLQFPLFILFGLCIMACSKTDETILPDPIFRNGVNLSNLSIGQKSYYIQYETSCAGYESDFLYTGDTLVLEVIEKDGQIALQESFTPHSPLYLEDIANQRPRIVPVKSQNGRILLPARETSSLFFFYGNDTLHLEANHASLLKQEDCHLMQNSDPFVGNDIAWINRFQVGDIEQRHKTVVSCVPFFELDAYLIYDKNQLYQSHTINITEFMGEILEDVIRGWVLLEQ